MKTFMNQFQELIEQTKKLMKQLKKKKSSSPLELEKIEKALAKTSDVSEEENHSFSLKDAR